MGGSFPGKGKGVGRVGGWCRDRQRNLPFSNYPLVSPRTDHQIPLRVLCLSVFFSLLRGVYARELHSCQKRLHDLTRWRFLRSQRFESLQFHVRSLHSSSTDLQPIWLQFCWHLATSNREILLQSHIVASAMLRHGSLTRSRPQSEFQVRN